MTILGVHIFHNYSSNVSTSNHTVLTVVSNFRLWSVQHVCEPVGSRQPQDDKRLFTRTEGVNICVCGAVYVLSRIFSPFSLSEQ